MSLMHDLYTSRRIEDILYVDILRRAYVCANVQELFVPVCKPSSTVINEPCKGMLAVMQQGQRSSS